MSQPIGASRTAGGGIRNPAPVRGPGPTPPGGTGWEGSPEDAPETQVAGALFLIRVLEELGMREFLAEHPAAVQAGVAVGALLRAIRDHAPPGDPLLRLLSSLPRAPFSGDAVLPDRWAEGVRARGATLLAPREGRPPWLLVDGSGRLPLAIWHRIPSPGSVRGTLRGRLASPWQGVPPAEILAEAWRLAARRWCRRRVGMGLHALLRRTGKLHATGSHLDLVLPAGSADTRIRRMGLDTDPGWVPWLGRVVRIGYRGD